MTILPSSPGARQARRLARKLPLQMAAAHIVGDLNECGQLLIAASHLAPDREFAARVAPITDEAFRLELLEGTSSYEVFGASFPVYWASTHVGTLYAQNTTNGGQSWPLPTIDLVNCTCAFWLHFLSREVLLRRLDLPTDLQVQAVRRLSTREREVLQWLMGHQTVAVIAAGLKISRRTVESHCAKVYEKLGVRSQHAAIQTGLAAGLIPHDTLP